MQENNGASKWPVALDLSDTPVVPRSAVGGARGMEDERRPREAWVGTFLGQRGQIEIYFVFFYKKKCIQLITVIIFTKQTVTTHPPPNTKNTNLKI